MRFISSRSLRAGCLAVCLTGGLAPAVWGAATSKEETAPSQAPAGLDGQIEELRAKIAAQPQDQDDEIYATLATLLLEADRAGEAVVVLEGALSRGWSASWRLTEQLAALHVLAGHPGKVDELARRFQKTASESDRPLSHLLLARADLARYRPDDALAHYRDFFAAGPADDQGASEEYLALLYETGNAAEAVKFLESRWEALPQSRIQSSRSQAEFIAGQFTEAGFEKAALEGAYRALIRLDPKRARAWELLALSYLQRQDPAKALAALEESYRAIGSRPAELLLLQGRIHLESRDAASAIRVLREVREQAPDLAEADELLNEAYRVFARQN